MEYNKRTFQNMDNNSFPGFNVYSNVHQPDPTKKMCNFQYQREITNIVPNETKENNTVINHNETFTVQNLKLLEDGLKQDIEHLLQRLHHVQSIISFISSNNKNKNEVNSPPFYIQ
jgi:hypothetical protein